MALIPNRTQQKLASGEIACGISLLHSRTVNCAPVFRRCGYDWLFIDMEHNFMDIHTATEVCGAALYCGITPIVRVPGPEEFHASRALDGGAQGIVFPRVNVAAEARRAVSLCKYPPRGRRSHTGAKPQLDYERLPVREALAAVDNSILVVIMLETAESIAEVEAIAAVDGVDVLFIGTQDLAISMGIPGELASARIVAAYERTLAVAAQHGRIVGVGGVYEPELMRRFVGLGARFLLLGSDLELMTTAARQQVERARALFGS